MTREEMQNIIIGIYGFEHEVTKGFFELCERWEDNDWNNKCLEILVECHQAEPIVE